MKRFWGWVAAGTCVLGLGACSGQGRTDLGDVGQVAEPGLAKGDTPGSSQENGATPSQDSPAAAVAAAAPPCDSATGECCLNGVPSVTLSQGNDNYTSTTVNQCVLGRGGNDTIFASGAGHVYGGLGDDTMTVGPQAQLVSGGPGRDTVQAYQGAKLVTGGSGEDTVMTGVGATCVYPGPQEDVVATGQDDDVVAIWDMCEVGRWEQLDGGSGYDTLISPVPVAQLKSLGMKVTSFENVVVQKNSCRSDCVTKPNCSGHGHCAEGVGAGQVKCECDPGFSGAACSVQATESATAWRESAIRLGAAKHYSPLRYQDGEVVLPQAVTFTLPETLRVTAGNAGNGSAELHFETVNQQGVTCTYRGRSIAHPVTDLQVAKGLFYYFESCQVDPGDKYHECFGQDFKPGGQHKVVKAGLHVVQGDSTHFLGKTVIAWHSDDGCSGIIPDPLSPEKTVEIRESFNWQSTQPVAELDAQGRPTLHYALIYIQDREELRALDAAKIHWEKRWLFGEDYPIVNGKCGLRTYEGDLKGFFVFAMVPGKAYNAIREAKLSGALTPQPGDRGDCSDDSFGRHDDYCSTYEPLKAVVRWQPPAFVANADGTISYEKLMQKGMRYRPGGPGVRRLANAERHGGGALDDAITAIVDIAEEVGEVATELLGAIDIFASGKVRIDLDFDQPELDKNFRDPISLPPFGYQPMVRAWSAPGVTSYVEPTGMHVELQAWVNLLGLGVDTLPVSFDGYMDAQGKVSIDVAENNSPRDGGVCIHFENDAAWLRAGITEEELCSYSGVTSPFGNFEQDMHHVVSLSVGHAYLMAQLTDTYQFVQERLGYEAYDAEVAVGGAAERLNFRDGKKWAPCLDFPTTGDALLTTIVGLVLGPAGLASLIYFPKVDIVIPDPESPSSDAINREYNRGVPVHEYGHFVTCSLLYGTDPIGGLDDLLLGRILEGGGDILPDDPTAYLQEGFADFVSAMVVSGTNYFRILQSLDPADSSPSCAMTKAAWSMNYCVTPSCDGGAAPCLDTNIFAGGQDDVRAQGGKTATDYIARAATIFYDAFDGGFDIGSNGDAWQLDSQSLLTRSSIAYGDFHDEKVILSAAGDELEQWFSSWRTNDSNGFNGIVESEFLGALGRTILARHNWCETCELFANHTFPAPTDAYSKWQRCLTDPELVNLELGLPPDPDLNMDPATCEPCPPGTTRGDLRCNVCEFGQATSDGECIDCDSESTVSLPELSGSCDLLALFQSTPTGGDACQQAEFVEMTGVGQVPGGALSIKASLAFPVLDVTQQLCEATSIGLNVQVGSPDIANGGILWGEYRRASAHGGWIDPASCPVGDVCVDVGCTLQASIEFSEIELGTNLIESLRVSAVSDQCANDVIGVESCLAGTPPVTALPVLITALTTGDPDC